jgi:hypothetical protein
MHKEFWWGNLLGSIYFENQEAVGRITLRWILGRYVVRIGDGWN